MKTSTILFIAVIGFVVVAAAVFSFQRLREKEEAASLGQLPGTATTTDQAAREMTVTLSDNNTTIPMQVGDTFLLKLGEGYSWDVSVDNPDVLSLKPGVSVVRGAQGIYTAKANGMATLKAIGDPVCREATPACEAPSIMFALMVEVGGQQAISRQDQTVKNFASEAYGISIQYPGFAAADAGAGTPSLGWQSGSEIAGTVIVEITIPKTFEPDTNFGDARLVVGRSADAKAVANCLKPMASAIKTPVSHKTVNGIDYTIVEGSDAGAGNYYDIVSWRAVKDKACYSIDQIIHSTNLANYPPEIGIKAFDQQRVRNVFDQMTATLTISK